MCGRIACALDPDSICDRCSYKGKDGKKQRPIWKDNKTSGNQFRPSYNISPGNHTPVMLSSKHFASELDHVTERIIQPMYWGLVPSWHKGDPKKMAYGTNNCKSETMLEKKTFKTPLEKGRRCVVLAEGFYEWKKEGEMKQPYFISFSPFTKSSIKSEEMKPENEHQRNDLPQNPLHKVKKEEEKEEKLKEEEGKEEEKLKEEVKEEKLKEEVKEVKEEEKLKEESLSSTKMTEEEKRINETEKDKKDLLMMAGVFDIWYKDKTCEPLYSYSVLTVSASSIMADIHHRMPAILSSEEDVEKWLSFGEIPLKEAAQLIKPQECLSLYPVSTFVNNSKNNSPDCIKPVVKSKPKTLLTNWLSQSTEKKIKKESKEEDEEIVSKKIKLEK